MDPETVIKKFKSVLEKIDKFCYKNGYPLVDHLIADEFLESDECVDAITYYEEPPSIVTDYFENGKYLLSRDGTSNVMLDLDGLFLDYRIVMKTYTCYSYHSIREFITDVFNKKLAPTTMFLSSKKYFWNGNYGNIMREDHIDEIIYKFVHFPPTKETLSIHTSKRTIISLVGTELGGIDSLLLIPHISCIISSLSWI